jgi:hypothetical protein
MIFRRGGHPVDAGEFFTCSHMEDPDEAYWDEVLLVSYRSRRDVLAMVTAVEYQEIARDRTAGIAEASVAPTSSAINLATPRLLALMLLLLPGLLFDRLPRRRAARLPGSL